MERAQEGPANWKWFLLRPANTYSHNIPCQFWGTQKHSLQLVTAAVTGAVFHRKQRAEMLYRCDGGFQTIGSSRKSVLVLIVSLFHNSGSMMCWWNRRAADVKQMEIFLEFLIDLGNSLTLDTTEVNSLNLGKLEKKVKTLVATLMSGSSDSPFCRAHLLHLVFKQQTGLKWSSWDK